MPSLFKHNYQTPSDSFQTVSLNLSAFQNVLQNRGPLAAESLGTAMQEPAESEGTQQKARYKGASSSIPF